jgi:hypothetical protein
LKLVLFNTPDYYDGVGGLYQGSIFPPAHPKVEYCLSTVSSPPSGASPYPEPAQVEKPAPILIEPPKPGHSIINQWIIEALHPTVKRIVESWSGESRESQEKVLNKMIKELDKDSQNVIRQFAHGSVKVDIEHLRRILDPLCGSNGRLCLVNRGGSQSGVSSIVCNQCQKSFDGNPVQAYAHHLITFHWEIKAFACYATSCNKRFAWTHDRDRHERSKHNLYRRKAYDLAMKHEAEEGARTKAPKEAPKALTDAEKLYLAFRGYNELTNSWE